MICLSLTRSTLTENLDDVRANLRWIDAVELRADRLTRPEASVLTRFPAELARDAGSDRSLPCILTLRRPPDGGSFGGSEEERRNLLEAALSAGGWDYVDLELDLLDTEEGTRLAEIAAASGTRIIRSYHDFDGVPEKLEEVYRRVCTRHGEIPKLALTPRGSADLRRLLRLLRDGAPRERIVIGMGEVGFPTRVVAPLLGGFLSYASADIVSGVAAAPGHVTPQTLCETYRYHSLSPQTVPFGIIGNPVMHSGSPAFHNAQFREKNLDAVYVPFQVDDLDAFFETADLLGIRGLSVTVPHKETVIAYLDESDESVTPVGACNTVLVMQGRRRGLNTDVPGFMLPLERAIGAGGPEAFDGMRATVIGAGGAARAVVFGLLRVGVRLCVVNRTVERAERMSAEIADWLGLEHPLVAPLDESSGELIREHGTLIVQTTSVGMEPNVSEDPLSFYEFRGHEIAYDLVYRPENTRFLTRARAAGCVTIPGTAMFEEQALAQAAHFEHLL